MLVQFLDGKGYWIPMQYIFLVEILLFGRLFCGYLEEKKDKKNIKVLWFQLTLKINIYATSNKKKTMDKQIDDVPKQKLFCI